MFLLKAWFHSLRLWIRGFHDLLREKQFSLLMLALSLTCFASLMMWSMHFDFLAIMLVLCSWI